MLDGFKIYVERLRSGEQEIINERFEPDFLEAEEVEEPITVRGKAYLAGHELIINLDIELSAVMMCTVCNKYFNKQMCINGFYHVEPLQNITSSVFDFSDILREAIVLELPQFAECNDGNCDGRREIEKYFTKTSGQHSNCPMEDLL